LSISDTVNRAVAIEIRCDQLRIYFQLNSKYTYGRMTQERINSLYVAVRQYSRSTS
jgi:hypothetical protein